MVRPLIIQLHQQIKSAVSLPLTTAVAASAADACYGSEEIDQRDLLFQQVGRLERIARTAENAGQFSAAVGAITALNRMMALGADQKGFRGHSNHQYRRF